MTRCCAVSREFCETGQEEIMRMHWLAIAACVALGACVPPPPPGYGYGPGYRQPYGGAYQYQYAPPPYPGGYVPPFP